MEKTEAYKKLVEEFGEEAVADAILAKWLADEEGTESWMRLAAACGLEIPERAPSHNNAYAERNGRSMGQRQKDVPWIIQHRHRLGTARI